MINVTPTLEAITTNVGSSGVGVLDQQLGCMMTSTTNSSSSSSIIARIVPKSSHPISIGLPQQDNHNKKTNNHANRVYLNTVEFVDASHSPSAPPLCSFSLLPQEGEISSVSIFTISGASLMTRMNNKNNTNNKKQQEKDEDNNNNPPYVVFAFIGTTRGWHILLHVRTVSSTSNNSSSNQEDDDNTGQVLWIERRVSVTAVSTSAIAPYSHDAVVASLGASGAGATTRNDTTSNTNKEQTTAVIMNKAQTNPALVVVHDCGLAAVYLADQFLPFVAKLLRISSSSKNHHHHHTSPFRNFSVSIADRIRIHQLPPDDAEVEEFYKSHQKYQITPRAVVNLGANISELQQSQFSHRRFLLKNGVSTAIVSSCCMIPCSSVSSSSSSSSFDASMLKLFKIQLWLASNTFGLLGTSISVDCSETTTNNSNNTDLNDSSSEVLSNSTSSFDRSYRSSSRPLNQDSDDDDDDGLVDCDDDNDDGETRSMNIEKQFAAINNNTSSSSSSHRQQNNNNNQDSSSSSSATFQQKAVDTALAIVAQTVFNNKTVADLIRMSGSAYNKTKISLSRGIDTYPSCPFSLALPPPLNDSILLAAAKVSSESSATSSSVNINTTPSIHPIVCSESSIINKNSNNNNNHDPQSYCCAIFFPYSDGRVFIILNDIVIRVIKGVRDSSIFWLRGATSSTSSSVFLGVFHKKRQILEMYDVLCSPTRSRLPALEGDDDEKNTNHHHNNKNNNSLRISACKLKKVLDKKSAAYHSLFSLAEDGSSSLSRNIEWEIIPRTTTIDGFGGTLCVSCSSSASNNNNHHQEQFWIRVEDVVSFKHLMMANNDEDDSHQNAEQSRNNKNKNTTHQLIFQVPTIPPSAEEEEIKSIVETVLKQDQRNHHHQSSSSSKTKTSYFEQLVTNTVNAKSIMMMPIKEGEDSSLSPADSTTISSLETFKKLQFVLRTVSNTFVSFHASKKESNNSKNNKNKKSETNNKNEESNSTNSSSSPSPTVYFEIMSKSEATFLRKSLMMLDAILVLKNETSNTNSRSNHHVDATTANFFAADDNDDTRSVITTVTNAPTTVIESAASTANENNNINSSDQNDEKKKLLLQSLSSPQKQLRQLLSWCIGVVAGTQKAIGSPSSIPSRLLSTQPDPRSEHALESILRDNEHQHGQKQRSSQSSAVLDCMREEVEELFISDDEDRNHDKNDNNDNNTNDNTNDHGQWMARIFSFTGENIRLNCSSSSSSKNLATVDDIAILGELIFSNNNSNNSQDIENDNNNNDQQQETTSSSLSSLFEALRIIRHPTNAMMSVGLKTKELSYVFLTWICSKGWSIESVMKRLFTTNNTNSNNESEENNNKSSSSSNEAKLNFRRLLTVIGSCTFADLKFLCLRCKDLNWSRFAKWICLLRISFRMDSALRHGSHLHEDAKYDDQTEVDFLATFVRSVAALEKSEEYFDRKRRRLFKKQLKMKNKESSSRDSSSNSNSSRAALSSASLVKLHQEQQQQQQKLIQQSSQQQQNQHQHDYKNLGHLCSFGGSMTSFVSSYVSSSSNASDMNSNSSGINNSNPLLPIHRCSTDFTQDPAVWKWTNQVLDHSMQWTALFHRSIFKKVPASFFSFSSTSTFQPTPSSIFYNYAQLLSIQENMTPSQLEYHHKAQDVIQISSLAMWLLEYWNNTSSKNNSNNSKNKSSTTHNKQNSNNNSSTTIEDVSSSSDDNNNNSNEHNKNQIDDAEDMYFIADAFLTISHLLDAAARKATVKAPEEYYDDDNEESDELSNGDEKENKKTSKNSMSQEHEHHQDSAFHQKDMFRESLNDPSSIDSVLITHLSITSVFAALVRSVVSKFWPSIVMAKSIETIHLQQQQQQEKKNGNTYSSSSSVNVFYRNLSMLLDITEHCTSRLNFHLSRLLQVLDCDAAREAAQKQLFMDDTRALASITIAKFVSNDSSLSLPLASPSLVYELSSMSQLENRAFIPLYASSSSSSQSHQHHQSSPPRENNNNNDKNIFRQKYLATSFQNSIKHVCQITGGVSSSGDRSNNTVHSSPAALLRIIAVLRVMLKHAGVFRAASRGSNNLQHQATKEDGTTSSLAPLTPSRLLLCFNDDDDDDEESATHTKRKKKSIDDTEEEDDDEPEIEELLLSHEKSPHVKILSQLCQALSNYRSSKYFNNNNNSSSSTTSSSNMMKLSDYDAVLEYDTAWRGGGGGGGANSNSNTNINNRVANNDIISQSAHYVWSHAMIHALQSGSSFHSSSSSKSNSKTTTTMQLELGQHDDLVLHDLIRKVNHKSIVSVILMRELRRRLGLIVQKLERAAEDTSSVHGQKSANDILLSIPLKLRQWALRSPAVKNRNEVEVVIMISKLFLQRCYTLAARVVELKSSSGGGGGGEELQRARSVATTFKELISRFK